MDPEVKEPRALTQEEVEFVRRFHLAFKQIVSEDRHQPIAGKKAHEIAEIDYEAIEKAFVLRLIELSNELTSFITRAEAVWLKGGNLSDKKRLIPYDAIRMMLIACKSNKVYGLRGLELPMHHFAKALGMAASEMAELHSILLQRKHTFSFRYMANWIEVAKNCSDRTMPEKRPQGLDLLPKYEGLFTDHLPNLTVLSEKVLQELLEFQNNYMPIMVSEEKEKETTRYLSMTTIATFFSSITAATLQFSVQNSGSTLGRSVNLLWLSSLAFSIASGINSLLGMTWKRTISQRLVAPRFVYVWVDGAPMLFLIISALLFAVGLVLFAFLSQTSSIATVTTIFTGLHIFGLIYLTLWFFIESRHTSKIAIKLLDRHRRSFLRILRWKRCVLWVFGYDTAVMNANMLIGRKSSIIGLRIPEPGAIVSRGRRLMRILASHLGTARQKVVTAGGRVRDYIWKCRASDKDPEAGKPEVVGYVPPATDPGPGPYNDLGPVVGNHLTSLYKTFNCPPFEAEIEKLSFEIYRKNLQRELILEKLSVLFWGYPELMEYYLRTIIPSIHARDEEGARKYWEEQKEIYRRYEERQIAEEANQEAKAEASDNLPSSSTSSPEAGNTTSLSASTSMQTPDQPSPNLNESQSKPPRKEGEVVMIES